MATHSTAAEGADQRDLMTPRPLIIVGGGEHARVVADAAGTRPEQWRLIGYAAPDGATAGSHLRLPYLGDDAVAAGLIASVAPPSQPLLVIGIGRSLELRLRVVEAFGAAVSWATVVHSTAWIADDARLDAGVVALAGAIVNSGARIGPHAIINTGAIVEHDVTVGLGAHLGPGSVVGGGSSIGAGVTLGMGSIVRDHTAVGDGAVVGMGAVVVDNVTERTVVIGIPARRRDLPSV